MSEFVPITEDFPQHDRNYENLTVEVMVKTNNGKVFEAFCFEPDMTWYDAKEIKKIRENVIAWKSKGAHKC